MNTSSNWTARRISYDSPGSASLRYSATGCSEEIRAPRPIAIGPAAAAGPRALPFPCLPSGGFYRPAERYPSC